MTSPLLESLTVLPRILTRLKRPTWRTQGCRTHGLCHACGAVGEFAMFEVLPAALAEDWHLTPAMKATMDRRESGACSACGGRYRARQVARALVELYGTHGEASLADLMRSEAFASTRILGIDLDFLAMLDDFPGFARSDYITSLVPVRGLPDDGLPFPDASFDLVLVSDTLEHVPRYRRALEEIRRVLTRDGRFITVQPVILSRTTVTRCVVDEGGTVRHMLPPSYHCRGADDSLVFVEFGIEFLDEVAAAGLEMAMYFYNVPADDYTWVAVCRKTRA